VKVSARRADKSDVPVLLDLYRVLEDEMTALHPMWPLADGLPEPVADSLEAAISDPEVQVWIGEIEEVPFGFLLARVESLLPQSRCGRVGSIRLVFSHPDAREVGLAEAMREAAMEEFRRRDITRFDAHVLPGHRLAKNFFEAGGFSARSIIMHHDDHPTERPGRDPRRF
jgi:GNAT superfamily N-acetyltransferase